MRVAACYTYTSNSNQHFIIFLSLIPSISLFFCIFKSVAHLSRECRSRVCHLTRADITADFFSPLSPLFCTSFPFASALFVPLSCSLFLLSLRLSPCGARFSFLLLALFVFRCSQTFFHFTSFDVRYFLFQLQLWLSIGIILLLLKIPKHFINLWYILSCSIFRFMFSSRVFLDTIIFYR